MACKSSRMASTPARSLAALCGVRVKQNDRSWMRRDNKFVLLLASDVATFAWVLAICIPPRPLGFAVALILGFVGGVAYRRARRIDQPLSQKERRTRAGVTIGGYSLWISGIIWAAT